MKLFSLYFCVSTSDLGWNPTEQGAKKKKRPDITNEAGFLQSKQSI